MFKFIVGCGIAAITWRVVVEMYRDGDLPWQDWRKAN